MLNVKVVNFAGVKNQFIIRTNKGVYFQSYDSIIAYITTDNKTYLDKNYWCYSNTTGKYRNMFLNDSGINETRAKIKNGEYILTDLNK